MKLYTYWRSSASYRLRIALEWKGLAREDVAIDLGSGKQLESDYLALNPQGLVPVLVEGERAIGQSLAILEYLEERYPQRPLLPGDPLERARVRQLALVVACEIHPLQNLRVLRHLESGLGQSQEQVLAWFRHWVARGLSALEDLLGSDPRTGRFCHGDAPTLADVCLVPQLYNARRRELDLEPYPTLLRVEGECLKLSAFARAAPESQLDAG